MGPHPGAVWFRSWKCFRKSFPPVFFAGNCLIAFWRVAAAWSPDYCLLSIAGFFLVTYCCVSFVLVRAPDYNLLIICHLFVGKHRGYYFRIRSAGGASTSAVASSSSSSLSASSSPTPRTRPSWCYTCRQASKEVFEWEMFASLFSLKNIYSIPICIGGKIDSQTGFSVYFCQKTFEI